MLRDFKVPEGFAPEDLRAAGDGEVLAVLDLRRDDSLVSAGLARELVNRVQRLRKAAGLVVTDTVEIFYRTEGVCWCTLPHNMPVLEAACVNCAGELHRCVVQQPSWW